MDGGRDAWLGRADRVHPRELCLLRPKGGGPGDLLHPLGSGFQLESLHSPKPELGNKTQQHGCYNFLHHRREAKREPF